MSDFRLDVDSPFPPPPPPAESSKPERIHYHDKEIEFRHYGKIISMLIEKAMDYADGAEKDALVKAIANQMKKSYLSYNRESVNDELIENQLGLLSRGNLKLHEDARLTHTNDILAAAPKVVNKKKKPYFSKDGKSNNYKHRKKNP
jgi:hypothetical protein